MSLQFVSGKSSKKKKKKKKKDESVEQTDTKTEEKKEETDSPSKKKKKKKKKKKHESDTVADTETKTEKKKEDTDSPSKKKKKKKKMTEDDLPKQDKKTNGTEEKVEKTSSKKKKEKIESVNEGFVPDSTPKSATKKAPNFDIAKLKAALYKEEGSTAESPSSGKSFGSEVAKNKLKSSQFRFLNEKLYSQIGAQSLKMFTADKVTCTLKLYLHNILAQDNHNR